MGVDETATPLERLLRDHGAWIAVRHGQRVAVHFGSVVAEIAVCRLAVGLADRFGRVTFDVRGARDRVDAALQRIDREGVGWAARIDAHQAVVRAEAAGADGCLAALADDDLLVLDATAGYTAVGLVGPRAGDALEVARLPTAPFPATVVPEPHGYEILVPPQFGSQAWVQLLRSCRPVGIACVGFDALEHLEIARRVQASTSTHGTAVR
jgi:glycine cleavage system aminomethyltransferase T